MTGENSVRWLGSKLDSLKSPFNETFGFLNGEPERVIIALHGFGDNAKNFSSLGKEISLKNTLWLFPNAPKEIPGFFGGSQWFPLMSNPYSELKNSIALVHALCDYCIQSLSISRKRIFLFGFSQGASTALECALTSTEEFAGAVALSGFILNQHCYFSADTMRHKNLPIFIGHGLQDQVVFPALYYENLNTLTRAGYTQITKREYQLGHSISPQEIQDIIKFIERLH